MWNAELIGLYEKERQRPVWDLIRHLEGKEFQRIIDVGCGTGKSTLPLKSVFPQAEVTGVDDSEEMLRKAKESDADINWLLQDGSKPLTELGRFDLVFSNAFMPWIPDQEAFIRYSRFLLNKGGIFAAQIPDFEGMAVTAMVREVVAEMDPSGSIFQDVEERTAYNTDVPEYYNAVSRYFPVVDVWETEYFYQMESQKDIVDFLRGALLRPYLAMCDEAKEREFLDRLLIKVAGCYTDSENGTVLFPFKRIFILAEK